MSTLRHESDALTPEQANGTVAEVYPKLCRVRVDGSPDLLLCPYRRAQVYNRKKGDEKGDGKGNTRGDKKNDREDDVRERAPVAVGDRVKVKVFGKRDGLVEGVATRKNQLARIAPGREGTVVQVIAANVDQLVILAAAHYPDFSPGFVDRFLVAAQTAGIPTLLCINKMDTVVPSEDRPWTMYEKLGVEILEISVKENLHLDELCAKIKGKLSVFCGHSGVGKTSVLRALLKKEIGAIGDLNAVTQKGKHTTTSAVLLEGETGLRVIDTPGLRELGLLNVSAEDLQQYFPELENLQCPGRECSHSGEEGCLAIQLPRYGSYQRILESLKELEERQASKPGRKSPWR
jgi:ribosome biogenesis GTPase